MVPVDYPVTSATTNLRCVTSQKPEDLIYSAAEAWNRVQCFYIFICFALVVYIMAPRRYPYFDVVVGLVWSHDPKSYAGGSVCYW
jgi:hypothetical protein